MTTQVMIDLETFGTTPGSAILSIGAVKFDPATNEIGETFYDNISLQSCVLTGLTIDPDTVAWWRGQSASAQSALLDQDCVALGPSLLSFSRFLQFSQDDIDTGQPIIWCKGGSFDFPLLAAAYRALGLMPTWKFWNERCCRTLFNLCRDEFGYQLPKVTGTAHNALDDARHQAEQVMACLALMRATGAKEAAL